MDVCVACCRGISDRRTEDIKVHNGQTGQREREKKENDKKNPSRGAFSSPIQTTWDPSSLLYNV
jgi:hypothetical protein